ncbi:MAG: hypothetical protein JW874_14235 [Spirochaetales bacterium]|nr:hypothetical protein [Spirochaetales bacterium]
MNITEWIRSGDPSLAFLADRDLKGIADPASAKEIGKTGWCARLIANRNPDGSWGRRFYQPKWICSHYTILELRNLCYHKKDPLLRAEINRIGREEKGADGGVNPAVTVPASDICVSAMYLNYAAYFGADPDITDRVTDFILSQKMKDGGYNCNSNQTGAVHSSLHTSVCVLEAFRTCLAMGNDYRSAELRRSIAEIVEFMLEHRLFRSSTSGEIIDKKMLILTYPFRWKYTILRGLNAFADGDIPWDERMEEALDFIAKKQGLDGSWKMQANYPGQTFFSLEEAGKPSRIITCFALKILKKYRNYCAGY